MSAIIEMQDLSHTFLPGSPYERQALKNISLTLNRGEFLGIFGSNGSGKSTLAKHLNGLLQPTSGTLRVCGLDPTRKDLSNQLWKKVGLAFQYPEQQIFEANIYDETAYGLRNLGLNEEEIKGRVYEALEQVGLDPKLTASLAPINLSGGIRRRVAIAGILALEPEILVLDEPMAGLDPVGRRLILDIIKNRREKGNETTVIISHDLKEILPIADKIAILDQGTLAFYGETRELLANRAILTRLSFELPDYLQVVYALANRGVEINTDIRSMDEAAAELLRFLKGTPGERKL